MSATRRSFLGRTAAAGIAAALVPRSTRAAGLSRDPDRRRAARSAFVRPPRLVPGDTVGLINPSSVTPTPQDADVVGENLSALGLKVKVAPHALGVRTSPEERARDVNAMFLDPEVQAILPIRGGWGCARLLQYLDYRAIARHPKVLIGYSDTVALLLAINTRTRLVTFHGPMGNSAFTPATVAHMKRVLFESRAVTLTNSADGEAIRTITPGRTRGRLFGGNLTVISSIVGSPFLKGSDDLILFLEEVREPTSEVDRMLTQLDLAGILGRVRGLVFGQCTSCAPPMADRSFTFDQVLADHVKPLGIPAWTGAQIGHVEGQFTMPIGLPVEIDARRASIRLLEPAVV
jgi:muramoyltetrapeptide carboxypeptidase